MARLEALIEVLDRSKKRIVIAFGLALLLHFPMTPALPVLRLIHRLRAAETPPASSQESRPREVEVELREALRQDEARKDVPAPAEPPKSSLSMAPPTPQAAPPPPPPPPASVKFSKSTPSEKADADEPKGPKKEKVKDVGLEGMASKITGKPGVTLALWLSSLRENPLGKRLSEVAACDREWKVFVEQGVDLLNDFDGALLVGPGLFEPRQMTVAVRHALPKDRVHRVIDGLVRKSGPAGKWIADDVASVRLGRTQRMLMPQQSDLFFIAPSKGWEALHDVKQPLGVPEADGRLLSLVLAPPQKALARAGLTLPKRISELRLEVFANADQSLDVRVELEDASPEAAQEDVLRVSGQLHDFFADVWSVATTLGSLAGTTDADARRESAPRLNLSVDEKTLAGMIHLSPNQTKATLELAASLLCKKAKRPLSKAGM